MKEEILNLLSMEEVLNQYGIQVKHSQFSCPFHGTDKHPSAKAYKNSFYCFNCNKTGDLIQFVQYYFNLNFKDAIQKINIDFGLNLNKTNYYDKEKYEEIKRQYEIKKKHKLLKSKINDLCLRNICSNLCEINDRIRKISKEINYINWEYKTLEIVSLEQERYKLEYQFNILTKK